MTSLLYVFMTITSHCAIRPELSPCTCEQVTFNSVELSCDKVDSFNLIVDTLTNKISPNVSVSLRISQSHLEDMEMRSFNEMNLNLKKIRLGGNNLKSLPEAPFRGLSKIVLLSLSENDLIEIPKHALNHFPNVGTLDLAVGRIETIHDDDFKRTPNIRHLVLSMNQITRMDTDCFPKNLSSLHIGYNQIRSLNGTLKNLNDLRNLFINTNNISSLDNELPEKSDNIKMIMAANNTIEKLPDNLKNYPYLDAFYIGNNKLRSLDGVLKNARLLQELCASENQIEYLANDEFQDDEWIDDLNLSINNIKSLNSSLLPIRRLRIANFSYNDMEEFSMDEIYNLDKLETFDISHNKISKLIGRMENQVERNSFLDKLLLNHNRLKTLDRALMGLNKLRILILSNNEIERISPDDFIGLESLEVLDLSHNQLLSLEETSTTFLPLLRILEVSYNNLTKLEKDFHGLPVLCHANLTNNQISSISPELVSKTRCTNHGVIGKLEIWLDYNPIMCNESVLDLCLLIDNHKARIRGRSHCIKTDPNEEICSDPPVILTAPFSMIPQIIQSHQLQQVGGGNNPAVVQVIVPTSLVDSKALLRKELQQAALLASTTTASTTTTTTSTTTTTTTTPSPLSIHEMDSTAIPSTSLVVEASTIAPIAISETTSSLSEISSETEKLIIQEIVKNEDETIIEFPPNSSDTEDNSVHAKFVSVNLPSSEKS